jgi:thiamine-phosphate pyrophosphorylase
MITDRRRGGAAGGAVVPLVAAAARAGVHLVQVRERDLEARELSRLVAACVEAVQGSPARIVVNDRIDVALAAGAHGVHLRGDSPSPRRVRRILPPGFLIGRSVHAVEEAEGPEVDGADYLIFGPVFETASKPGVRPAGLALLEAMVRSTSLPVLAVGGVTAGTAAAVGRTGAAGVAGIGLFVDAGEKGVQHAVASLRNAFDTASHRS